MKLSTSEFSSDSGMPESKASFRRQKNRPIFFENGRFFCVCFHDLQNIVGRYFLDTDRASAKRREVKILRMMVQVSVCSYQESDEYNCDNSKCDHNGYPFLF